MRATGWSKAGAGAAALLLVLGAAACGDDDDEGTATTEPAATDDTGGDDGTDDGGTGGGEGEAAAFCDPFFELRGVLFETPEDETAGQYIEDEVVPKVEDLEAAADGDAAESASTFRSELDANKDDVEALFGEFEGGQLGQSFRDLESSAADDCGWERIDVDAVDFDYEGMPADLPAGKYAIVMTNATEAGELHEIGLVRPNDDTTETLDELLELPEEEADAKIEFLDGAFAPPGETSVMFVELDPGTYYYACFIPIGSGSEDEGEAGPPHFTAGMKGELTVS
jgi:hypothetical protein